MHYKLTLVFFICLSSYAFAFQNADKAFPPKSSYEGYRILVTNIQIQESTKDEILLSLNVVNTGRKPVELGTFSKIPRSLMTKFEESFYRSSLISKEEEIKNQIFGKDMELPIGKILRNISISVSSDEDLYKKLGKHKQKYARHYQPKTDKTRPNLNYKTASTSQSVLPKLNLKKKSSEAEVKEVVKSKKTKKEMPEIVEEIDFEEPKKKVKKEKVAVNKTKKEPAVKTQNEPKAKSKKEVPMTPKKESIAKTKKEPSIKTKKDPLVSTKKKAEVKENKESSIAKAPIKKRNSGPTVKKKEQKGMADAKVEKKKNEVIQKPKTEKQERPRTQDKIVKAEAKQKEKFDKKEIKRNEEKFNKIEKKKLKEKDDKEVLAILGVEEEKEDEQNNRNVTSKPMTKRSGSIFGEKEKEEESYSTKEGIEASKNSYAKKENCPDIVVDTITIIKQTTKWLHVEYTLSNKGKGPAHLYGETSSEDDNLAVRVFLSSSENLTRGSLPIGGGFVNYPSKDGVLNPQESFTGSLKLDIKKLTRFTPYLILSVDPFNALTECDKTNNKSPKLIK